MGKRIFAPLPQTVREKPGEKFKIMRRVASIACHPNRDELQFQKGWAIVPGAVGLSKIMAESMLEGRETSKGGEIFEYAIVPMNQEIP